MELANSIWYNEGFDVLQTFIDTNKFYYDAEVASLDFSDPTSKDIINGWCSDKTHGKIKDVLDAIPADAVMYLINAIYFNGIWTYQFDPEKSYTGTFYKEDGTTTDVAYMKMQQDIPCFQNDLFTAVELPYGNEKFSMCFLLPKGNHTINDLIENINADSLKVWTSQFVEKELVVTIPKFKFGYKDLLNDPLTNMGLGIAFGPLADFTGIRSSGGLMISRVIHQSFIDVNEKGTEAAAVTVVEIIETSVNPEMTFFMANHPFIFVLREKSSNALLFIGKVGVPEYGD
jgi:serpin B